MAAVNSATVFITVCLPTCRPKAKKVSKLGTTAPISTFEVSNINGSGDNVITHDSPSLLSDAALSRQLTVAARSTPRSANASIVSGKNDNSNEANRSTAGESLLKGSLATGDAVKTSLSMACSGRMPTNSDHDSNLTLQLSAKDEASVQLVNEENTRASVMSKVVPPATQDNVIATTSGDCDSTATQSAFGAATMSTGFVHPVQDNFHPTVSDSPNIVSQSMSAPAAPSSYGPAMNSLYLPTAQYDLTSAASPNYAPLAPPFYPIPLPYTEGVLPMYPSAVSSQIAPQMVPLDAFSIPVQNSSAPSVPIIYTPCAQPLYHSGVPYGEEIAVPQWYPPAALPQQPPQEVSRTIQTPEAPNRVVRAPDPCDDPSLGDFNGAGLSNKDYKIKVAELLANNRSLPPPEVIVKNKRLLRALPPTKHAAVIRWTRSHPDNVK